MTHNALKRILSMALALLLLCALPLTASAAQTDYDGSKTGSIRVQLRDVYFPENAIGGTLVLYRVGDVRTVDHNLSFVPTAEFSGSGVSLSDVNASGLPQKLADYAAKNQLKGTSVTADDKGYAAFTGLTMGLYLVTQTEAVEGYLCVDPFLVSLPLYDGEANLWRYDIDAAPKVQRPSREPVSLNVVKKWQDNNKNRPTSLTVHLLCQGEIADTVTLTAANGWKYSWTGLDAYYKWTVEEVVPEGYKATYSTYGDTVTITNKADWYKPPKDSLIQTGQLNWPVPVLVCLGLAMLAAGCVLLRRGKQDV